MFLLICRRFNLHFYPLFHVGFFRAAARVVEDGKYHRFCEYDIALILSAFADKTRVNNA
jgi:hypothetical protein